jgi:hypothetical protein
LVCCRYELGKDEIVYETDARRPVRSDAKEAALAATADARKRCAKTKGSNSRTQWNLGEHGDSIKTAVQTSVLPDPRRGSKDFGSYRGVLNPENKKTLRSSTAFEGSCDPNLRIDYRSNTTIGTEYHGSQTDYQGVKATARQLKKDLQSSKITFGNEKRELSTDYRDGFKYDKDKAKEAKSSLDPEQVKNLRASHFSPGDPKVKPDYTTNAEFNNKKFVEDAKGENRDLGAERARNKSLKLKLTRNTFQIGNDSRYMY